MRRRTRPRWLTTALAAWALAACSTGGDPLADVVAQPSMEPDQPAPAAEPTARPGPLPGDTLERCTGQEGWPGDPVPAGTDLVHTASGLRYAVLRPGRGEQPSRTDVVEVHYSGWRAADGTLFDSSLQRGAPATFRLDQVIPGWTEGCGRMRPGSKVKLLVPAALGYGARGSPPKIPPEADLVFDVELLQVVVPPKAPAFDWPQEAALTTTASGLRYQALEEGQGPHPGPTDVVTVHYAGWLQDGTQFDASFPRGKPVSFPLNRVIPGWTEGLQLMRPGARYRFVIPPELAYGARGSPPRVGPDATLLFHVELQRIGAAGAR